MVAVLTMLVVLAIVQGTGVGSNDKATNPSGCYDPKTMKQTQGWYQTEAQAKAQFSLVSRALPFPCAVLRPLRPCLSLRSVLQVD